jgi:hypothetical protein
VQAFAGDLVGHGDDPLEDVDGDRGDGVGRDLLVFEGDKRQAEVGGLNLGHALRGNHAVLDQGGDQRARRSGLAARLGELVGGDQPGRLEQVSEQLGERVYLAGAG